MDDHDRGVQLSALPASDGSAAERLERMLVMGIGFARLGSLLVGAGVVRSNWRRHRSRFGALAVLTAYGLESGWAYRRWAKKGTLKDKSSGAIDVAFCCSALVAGALAAPPGEGLSGVNWVGPASALTASVAALSVSPQVGSVATGALAASYLAGGWSNSRAGQRQVATGNVVSQVTWFVGTYYVGRYIRRLASDLDNDREKLRAQGEQLAEARERLAVSRERERSQRVIHDSALQTLEAVAGDWDAEAESIRKQAQQDASRLREFISTDGTESESNPHSLVSAMRRVVTEAAGRGVTTEMTVSGAVATPLAPHVIDALSAAAAEALNNVARHAGVSRAVLNVDCEMERVVVTIRDQGCGFDAREDAFGFGLSSSIVGRVSDVGGTADIWSAPGKGVRVTLSCDASGSDQ